MPIAHFASSFRRVYAMHMQRGSLFLSICCSLIWLSACGNVQTQQGVAPSTVRITAPYTGALVSFTSSTSYATALRLVTGLGLQLKRPCVLTYTDAQGNIVSATDWMPIGSKDSFKTTTGISTSGKIGETPTVTVDTILPALLIGTTALAPADWQTRLHASSAVSSINTHAVYNCPAEGAEQPAATTAASRRITSIAPKDAGTYAKVTFASTSLSYDDALYIASNMGFRLAAPCYEQEAGKPADWQPMGQQQAFASTYTLTLATSNMSPTDWRTRIAHAAGVTKIVVPDKVTC